MPFLVGGIPCKSGPGRPGAVPPAASSGGAPRRPWRPAHRPCFPAACSREAGGACLLEGQLVAEWPLHCRRAALRAAPRCMHLRPCAWLASTRPQPFSCTFNRSLGRKLERGRVTCYPVHNALQPPGPGRAGVATDAWQHARVDILSTAQRLAHRCQQLAVLQMLTRHQQPRHQVQTCKGGDPLASLLNAGRSKCATLQVPHAVQGDHPTLLTVCVEQQLSKNGGLQAHTCHLTLLHMLIRCWYGERSNGGKMPRQQATSA